MLLLLIRKLFAPTIRFSVALYPNGDNNHQLVAIWTYL